MAQVILKKSSVAGRVPLTTDLAFGELALNYADGLLYYKKSDGTTIGNIGGGATSLTLSSGTVNGVTYLNSSNVLTTSTALKFDGTNLLNTGSYTAPNNASGAGQKVSIKGATGTGAAGASGGNGFIELLGAGGSSNWTNFTSYNTNRRGGIYLQAGTAQGDSGNSYVNGSIIQILGSDGTSNGTTTGTGSPILIAAGKVTRADGTNNYGASITLSAANSVFGSGVTIAGGGGNTADFGYNGGGFTVSPISYQSGSLSGGDVVISGSSFINYNTGQSTGTGVTLICGMSGTSMSLDPNGEVYFTTGSSQKLQIGALGQIGFSGPSYGDAGQVLTSGGADAAPTWTTPSPAVTANTWTKITSATTATSGQQLLATSAVGTLTLPASPAVGDNVVVMDGGNWSTTNLTIARNGSTIESVAQDLTCDVAGTVITLVYDGSTWQVTANVGAQGPTGPQGPQGNSAGTSYSNQYLLTGTTTNATETEIFVGGIANSRIPVALGKTVYYTIDIVGRRTDVLGDIAAFTLKGVISNLSGTTADNGNLYQVVIARSDANYLVDARANNAYSAKSLYVTGVAGKTISWRAVVTTIEV